MVIAKPKDEPMVCNMCEGIGQIEGYPCTVCEGDGKFHRVKYKCAGCLEVSTCIFAWEPFNATIDDVCLGRK